MRMINQSKRIICIISVFSMLNMVLSSVAMADIRKNGVLKECLQSEVMYYSRSIDFLNAEQKKDAKSFDNAYDDRAILVSGHVNSGSIAKNQKKFVLTSSSGKSCSVDTSNEYLRDMVGSITNSDNVVVYGKLDVTGIINDSYEIIADKLVINPETTYSDGSYVFFEDDGYKGRAVTDVPHVKYFIPQKWDGNHIHDKVNNNGVNVNQYSLNALKPLNTEHAEAFYVFYFDNDLHLEDTPDTSGDYKDVEEAIVKNILPKTEEEIKVKMTDIKDVNGTKIDYFATTYTTKGKQDYSLEFLFRPVNNGIVCMLYLYFPGEAEYQHVHDVAYVVETMELENE